MAQKGCTGMKAKFTRAWMLTKIMPSQRAQAAPEITPNPAASTTMLMMRWVQPQLEAPVVIQ